MSLSADVRGSEALRSRSRFCVIQQLPSLSLSDIAKGKFAGFGNYGDGEGAGVGAGGNSAVDFGTEGESVSVVCGVGGRSVFGLGGCGISGGKSRISSTGSSAFSKVVAPSVVGKVIKRGSGSRSDGSPILAEAVVVAPDGVAITSVNSMVAGTDRLTVGSSIARGVAVAGSSACAPSGNTGKTIAPTSKTRASEAVVATSRAVVASRKARREPCAGSGRPAPAHLWRRATRELLPNKCPPPQNIFVHAHVCSLLLT